MKYKSKTVLYFTGLCGLLMLSGCSTIGKDFSDVGASTSESFEQRLARYSEDKLIREPKVDEYGTILVGTKKCNVADKNRLNQRFPISQVRKAKSDEVNAPFGLPLADELNDNEFFLYQDEHIILYNADLKLPIFASYRLLAEDIVSGDRIECFREDPRLDVEERSRTLDYHGDTDLDKGHLVPDADMQRSKDTVMNTYFMSNMMPQFGSVNSGSWKYIETATRLWAAELGEVYVISGAIFDRDGDGIRDADVDAERAPPTRKVAKPTAFYKIIFYLGENDNLRAISFILPHIQASTAPNPRYVPTRITSIDTIEEVTGLNFFPRLPNALQDALEVMIEPDLWCRIGCKGTP